MAAARRVDRVDHCSRRSHSVYARGYSVIKKSQFPSSKLTLFVYQETRNVVIIASAPSGFHLFHAPLGHLHADNCFPFSDQGSNLLLEPPAIPGVQYVLPFRGVAAGPHVEIHGLVVANDYCWQALLVNHIEQVTVPLIVVALTAHKLSC